MAGKQNTTTVAAVLEKDRNTYRRYEPGEIRPPWADLQLLLNYWKVHGKERERIEELWRQADQDAWWSSYGLDEQSRLLELESFATHIQIYEPALVTGALQTVPYARAVMHGMLPPETSHDDIENRVQLRPERQQRIYGDATSRPQLQVLLDETVLFRNVGGAEVMAAQLDYLSALDESWCHLRVLPLTVSVHPGVTGARWILHFPQDHPHGPVLYVDGAAGSLHINQPAKVDRAKLEFERMWNDQALATPETPHARTGSDPRKEPMTHPTPDQITWRNASADGGTCIDVGLRAGTFYIRDSKNPNGPMIPIPPTDYATLITALKQ